MSIKKYIYIYKFSPNHIYASGHCKFQISRSKKHNPIEYTSKQSRMKNKMAKPHSIRSAERGNLQIRMIFNELVVGGGWLPRILTGQDHRQSFNRDSRSLGTMEQQPDGNKKHWYEKKRAVVFYEYFVLLHNRFMYDAYNVIYKI